jgi:Holliday junction DNA helicase RuvA
MYDFINGEIYRAEHPAQDSLTIIVSSGLDVVGYLVHVAPRLVEDLRKLNADRCHLWLHHVINAEQGEEKLYGFHALHERAAFRELIKVKGIGPAGAMKILSGVDVATLAKLVGEKDVKGLKALPGVGPKMAERLITELKL